MVNSIEEKILNKIDDTGELFNGVHNIRSNGESISRNTSNSISIKNKEDKSGINVVIQPNTKNRSVHVPVIISNENITDTVYNTFDVGEYADISIVAGCGIHNCSAQKTEHIGIHEIFIHKGAKAKYIEKHYAESTGKSQKAFHTKTVIDVEEDGILEMELVQIKGVDDSKKDMEVNLHKNAYLIITERIFTESDQEANSNLTINLIGEDASAQIISRTVAKDKSKQKFYFMLNGKNKSRGHIECDSIIMGNAEVTSIPALSASCEDAQLIHEAAIGKIASDQLMKLMSLGLTEEEAQETILQGFLK
ncbi:SufD family Fe-S cluster assembly protein [Clostridium aestuarii]|uniref:SufD family Fe-S cluster assembly protein n=1 Tax=Clostridium aestuarii TaxID=338193 RepID=A0ABT4D1Y1_9CLOT|nr:SufD family Fe-S cluster assembly protein [Clostridium aestuarii]MCY6484295.1 SufD family Fe-S cluster assembly protein [Clostridium aestuarii]